MSKNENENGRPCTIRPFQRSKKLDEWPLAPQLDSGHLTASNAGWRTRWPEVTEGLCNACGLCFVFCPDAAITLDANGIPRIEPDWCKGCGICAIECPKDAIEMMAEEIKERT